MDTRKCHTTLQDPLLQTWLSSTITRQKHSVPLSFIYMQISRGWHSRNQVDSTESTIWLWWGLTLTHWALFKATHVYQHRLVNKTIQPFSPYVSVCRPQRKNINTILIIFSFRWESECDLNLISFWYDRYLKCNHIIQQCFFSCSLKVKNQTEAPV